MSKTENNTNSMTENVLKEYLTIGFTDLEI